MLKKLDIDNKEINFFIISAETGKIKSSGDENDDTWEDTYIDLNSIEVGKPPSICFNKAHRTRYTGREPVFTNLNYNVTLIKDLKDDKLI